MWYVLGWGVSLTYLQFGSIVLNVFRSCYLNQWFCKLRYISVSTIDLLGPGQHSKGRGQTNRCQLDLDLSYGGDKDKDKDKETVERIGLSEN